MYGSYPKYGVNRLSTGKTYIVRDMGSLGKPTNPKCLRKKPKWFDHSLGAKTCYVEFEDGTNLVKPKICDLEQGRP